MTSPWLPTWLGVTWAAVFVIILIVHLWHVIVMTGRDRLWHCVHVLMAAGMIVMFAATGRVVIPDGVGMAVFAAAALIIAVLLIRERVNHQYIGRLWLLTVIDLAAMVYMFAMMSTRLVWLTIPLVGWFVLQAAGWSSGRLYSVLNHGGLGGPQPTFVTGPVRTSASPKPARTATSVPQRRSGHDMHDGPVHHTVIRATLALMVLGMGYMMIAMQFGMATMAGM